MPFSPTEIKVLLLKKGVSIADAARTIEKKLARTVRREDLSRVIHGHYTDKSLRQALADLLGVPVSKVGREAAPRKQRRRAGEAAAL